MFISIRYFMIFLFFSNFIIFFYIQPQNLDKKNKYRNFKNIPQISFLNFKLYDFDENRIVRTILTGSYGEGFKNGFYRVKDVNLTYKSRENFENISSDFAYYRINEIEVIGNVKYQRTDGLEIHTDKISYDIKDDYFYIPNKFSLLQGGSKINGNTLVIKRENGTINAFNIEATIKKKDFIKKEK